MVKDIEFKRLMDVKVTGSFCIKCETLDNFLFVRGFFHTTRNYIKFKDIKSIDLKVAPPEVQTCSQPDKEKFRFGIKYESLTELLKIREVFNIRANKFDFRLIKKRGYNMFTDDFYQRCADMTIYKVKK